MFVYSVLEYINNNYKNPNLSVEMIAEAVGKSVNYTRAMFKKSMGISISEYIRKKRFEEVCRLLIETDHDAYKIGKMTGFESVNYFYTGFKKYTGMTCNQYREKNKNKQ